MRLTGLVLDGVRHIGRIEGDVVVDLGTADAFYADTAAGLEGPGTDRISLAEAVLAPPVPVTARIFCVGINYRSHAGEAKDLAGLNEPAYPMIFGRWQQSLIVEGESAPVPPHEKGLDWEVELAVVIGSVVWRASRETALDQVLGYAAFNDLSARAKQLATPQFTLGKNADRSGPISPLVTRDEVGDPALGLQVRTFVNGELMQDGNTRDLIHDIPAIISYITDTVTLLPGDVVATGTPGGVGAGRTPPIFLQPGDEVVVEVEKVGSVRTPIVGRD
ncbi:fumarylacetoacetate hydrolase [Acrocarpospora corrugata]|uniref:Fumarylacetoacetate hydrolase n=1 Tax=Acrocarpospora corrugata TaxID=35763 RepID=A0A5M3W7L0_9ACTN|nr:fumarylacetoacetate hydrolase family protein [Acrocarpospora corrugata]GES03151.1 fumarylacetoacetate hydrolase [Acrocarpospora corrugata]